MYNIFTVSHSSKYSRAMAWLLAFSMILQNAAVLPLTAYASDEESSSYTSSSSSSESYTSSSSSDDTDAHEEGGRDDDDNNEREDERGGHGEDDDKDDVDTLKNIFYSMGNHADDDCESSYASHDDDCDDRDSGDNDDNNDCDDSYRSSSDCEHEDGEDSEDDCDSHHSSSDDCDEDHHDDDEDVNEDCVAYASSSSSASGTGSASASASATASADCDSDEDEACDDTYRYSSDHNGCEDEDDHCGDTHSSYSSDDCGDDHEDDDCSTSSMTTRSADCDDEDEEACGDASSTSSHDSSCDNEDEDCSNEGYRTAKTDTCEHDDEDCDDSHRSSYVSSGDCVEDHEDRKDCTDADYRETHDECFDLPPPPPTTLSCDQVTGEGWYGQYYNSSRHDAEMNRPASEWETSHVDPKGALWTSDWYDADRYRFDRVDEHLMFGNDFFPFDGDRAEELDRNSTGERHDYHFATKWTAKVAAGTPGAYTAHITSDDDSWVYVNGVLVIDNSGIHGARTETGSLTLTTGDMIEVYFAERHVTRSHMNFYFSTPGITLRPYKAGCDTPPPPTNTRPVITVIGANMEVVQGGTYVEQSATVSDLEEGDITQKLVTIGTVNTSILGVYTITYNATDSQNLSAIEKTRTVTVVPPAECKAPLDVMMIIDRSGSMNDDGQNPEQPLTDAKNGASAFINTLSDIKDRAGVVSYSTTAVLNSGLSSDFIAVKASYASVTASGFTNTASAITRAQTELVSQGRTTAKKVMIILSDGVPNVDGMSQSDAASLTIASATAAKSAGTIIYAIGLGDASASAVLSQVASSPASYFFAPSGAQLEGIYRAISTIECQRDPATITGKKYNDKNANGIVDGQDVTIQAWTMTLTLIGASTSREAITNAEGVYSFSDVTPGNYALCEVGKTGWRQTFPVTNSGCYMLNVDAGAVISGKDFLNTESEKPECRDGLDNDGDGKADFGADEGCDDPEDNDENTRPVITILSQNPAIVTLGTTYVDQGATASDFEDGDITDNIITQNLVNTAILGQYTVKYNVTDSKGLSAVEAVRVVRVVSACSDAQENDGDGLADFPNDLGCDTPEDNDENDRPVITILGTNPLAVTVGTPYTDLLATVFDTEDKDITYKLMSSGTVNTAVLGTYTITYNATDSENLSAIEKTRTVTVVPVVTECNDNIDNDGDLSIDFDGHIVEDMAFVPDEGCDSLEDNDENDRPVITVLGDTTMTVSIGSVFVDPSATVFDKEDKDITYKLMTSGTVNTAILGTYTITYNATDSKNLPAFEKTRTVKVTSSCSDGLDNDQDGTLDYPEDTGCETSEDDTENDRPVITLLGDVVMSIVLGTPYTEASATVADKEDGVITHKLMTVGSVNTGVAGTYTITYNATDSQNLSAIEKTRTVTVTTPGCTINCGGGSTPPVCSDGGDNDGDALADYPRDPGCDSPQDNDERDIGPTLTLVGGNPLTVTQGTTFTDPGATARDPEEGDITSRIVVTGSVNAGVIGAYTLTYNVSDSQNHAATPVNRVVNVVPQTGCVTNCGGGGGPVALTIMNERITSTGSTTVVITWNTNLPASSRVVYGLDPVSSLGVAPLYGYGLTTTTSTPLVTSHSMTIDGIPSAASAYFRPISNTASQQAIGIELTRGGVLGDSDACFYLREHLRLGHNNNPIEVAKLQSFLRNYEGFTTLPVTGFFDIVTDKAVRSFQDKYASDVLTPWNLPGNTGYVYYTTKKKVNEIYCQRAFPLTEKEVAEVEAFKKLIAGNTTKVTPIRAIASTPATQPSITVTPIAPTVGVVAGVATVATPVEVSLTQSAGASETKSPNRIALAELLAGSPKMTEKLTADTAQDAKVETAEEGNVGVVAEAEAQVASAGATSGCMQYSCITIFLAVLFMIILGMLVYLFVRGQKDDSMQVS
jgi:fibro-slime domain-containing protein